MLTGAFVLEPQHEIHSTNFIHDVTPSINKNFWFRGEGKNLYCCFIDIQGRFRQNISLNCILQEHE